MFSPDEGDEEQAAPDTTMSDVISEKLGLGVIPITPEIAGQLGIPATTKGLAIAAIDPNSDSAAKGLARRDVILSANYKPVADAAALEPVIREAESDGRNAVLIQIQRRNGAPRYVPIRLR